MKLLLGILIFIVYVSTSCTLAPLQCFLNFSDYTKTYEFEFSKEQLKNRIVEAYSYDESLLKNFGKTSIENAEVNKVYRTSVDAWLDKNNWDNFKSEIRRNTPDTLNIILSKLLSRKQLELEVIVQGDENESSLTIHGFKYERRKACSRDTANYIAMLSEKIENKFINRLK